MSHRPDPLSLVRSNRVHEVFGASSYSFALAVAARQGGHVLWVRQHWKTEALYPYGAASFIPPERLLMAQCDSQVQALSVTEDTLRDGAISTVLVDLDQALTLTAGRRLQLAANAGQTVGICLISEGMGSNAAETRWQCYPLFDTANAASDSTLQSWELKKNKSGTLGVWNVRWDQNRTGAAPRLTLVPPVTK